MPTPARPARRPASGSSRCPAFIAHPIPIPIPQQHPTTHQIPNNPSNPQQPIKSPTTHQIPNNPSNPLPLRGRVRVGVRHPPPSSAIIKPTTPRLTPRAPIPPLPPQPRQPGSHLHPNRQRHHPAPSGISRLYRLRAERFHLTSRRFGPIPSRLIFGSSGILRNLADNSTTAGRRQPPTRNK